MTQTNIGPAPVALALGPVEQLKAGRLPRRLIQLAIGLYLYGASLALMVCGDLGLAPWDVLHSGAIRFLPITLGQAVVVFSLLVLILWIPLREKPGLATIANALLVGLSADLTLTFIETPDNLAARIALTIAGVALCGFATALYMGAQLGRGPRDGLMTGLHRVTGRSIRLVRTLLEITVVVIGVLLGGHLGFGTVLFALAIGPIAQALMPLCEVALPGSKTRATS